ncbi:DNA polymerase III subunit delta [Rheinheimera sp.]|uniref:DNA polymerase III subunit delta n=1 Tax=Rheinheimera sp. TaxID=1869214 RepID=UPI00307F520F
MLKLYSNQLAAQLDKQLAPVYLVFGEEPLQKQESLDLIRKKARTQGFDERLSFQWDPQFNWSDFLLELNNLSLFAPRRLFELELPAKLPAGAADQLKQLTQQLHPDLVLVLHASKNATEFARSSWFKQLAEQGVQVQFYPLDDQQFARWLQQRASSMKVQLSPDAITLLQHHCAGNLLAAAQELEKLALTDHQGRIDAALLEQFLADQSHYSVFQLVDALLQGQGNEALHRLHRLLLQDTEPVIIAWQLQKEIQTLLQMHLAQQQGLPLAEFFKKHGIWPKRQPMYHSAVARLPQKWLSYCIAELAAFDRAFKTGLLTDQDLALAHLVSLFVCPVPKVFSLQQIYGHD